MARILNGQYVNGPISKLVELPSSYIINGQFYNKIDMSPSPLDFGFYQTSTYCEMVVNQTAFTGCDLSGKITQGAIPDSSNSNISYNVKPGVYNHLDNFPYTIFYKTEKNGNDVRVKSYAWKCDAINKQNFGNIIDQDDNFLYVCVIGEGYKSLVFKLDKETMLASGIYDVGADKYVSVVRVTDMYIYLAITGANNYFVISKYNKNSGVATIIKDDTGATGGYSAQCIVAKDPVEPNTFYAIRDGYMQNNLHRSIIRKYVLDISSDTVDAIYMDMDLTGLTYGASLPNIDNKTNVMNELYTFIDRGISYLVYLRYGEGLTMANSSMFVFEFINSTTLKLVQETNFTPVTFNMALTISGNKALMLGNNGQVRFYSWNSTSKKYEHTASIVRPISIMGCDIDGNVLIQYQDSSVDMFSSVIAISLTANLEKEYYEYNGHDIASNAIVFAQNFTGEFISTSVKLTIIGPAVFSATNEKILTISTSNVNPNVIPITIKDSGYVRIAIEMIK